MFTPPFFTKQQKLSLTFKLKTEIGSERENEQAFYFTIKFFIIYHFFCQQYSHTNKCVSFFLYKQTHSHRSDTSERGEKKKPLPFIVKTGYIQIMS